MENISGLAQEPSYTPALQDKFRANPEFVAREIAGEFILVPIGKAAELFNGLASLNPTGVFLWKLLDVERTQKELGKFLAEKYELTEEQSMSDVGDFLEIALKRNIVLRC